MSLGVFTGNMDLYGGKSVFGDYNFGLPEQIANTIGEHSWSSCFYKHITSNIDEKIFAPLYSSRENTRSSSPVRLVVAAPVLKSKFGLKDDELLEHCISYAPFKNALGLGFFEDTPFSKNTFGRFRQRLEEHGKETGEDLMKQQMVELACKHCETPGIDGKTVRIDSMMIDSRGKFMTRLEIIVATNTKCLKDIAGSAGAAAIPDSLAHYLEPDNTNKTACHQEEAVVGSKVEKALADSLEIKKLMENAECPCLKSLGSYGTVCRLLDDQMKEDGDGEAVPKGKNEIQPGSMQNPHGPDATYRYKAKNGYRGFAANFVQAYHNGKTIIAETRYNANTTSDSEMFPRYMENSIETGRKPEKATTDGGYMTPETIAFAKEHGIDFHATSLAGPKTSPMLAKAVFSEDGKELPACGNESKPLKQSLQSDGATIRAVMDKGECNSDCPFFGFCHPKEQKNGMAVRTFLKAQERALYVESLGTDESKKRANERNGVEGVPSEMRNVRHVDEIPVAGKIRSKIFFTAMVTSRNFTSVFNNTCEKYIHKKKLAYERKKEYWEQIKQARQVQAA